MITVPTYTAHIYVGLQIGYTSYNHPLSTVERLCQEYVRNGLCVTVSPTKFIYTGGNEPGAVVGLINYPRFPADSAWIEERALGLASLLKEELGQQRVSIVFPDKTIMI